LPATGNSLIFLMKPLEARFFEKSVHEIDPAIRIAVAGDQKQLVAETLKAPPSTRLLAFSTNVIVPPRILQHLDYNCINFHPGPPSRPGYRPTGFALYDGDTEYGVTAHYMLEKVDSGPIVGARLFPLASDAQLIDVVKQSYLELARLFIALLPELACSNVPLQPNGMQWSGETSTRAQYEAIRQIPRDLSDHELTERFRCFDGIYSPLQENQALF